MQLNEAAKRKLRQEIMKKIKGSWIPDFSIKIDESILEDLIFRTEEILYEEKKVLIKFPVWTGEFLRKFDLSAVDFDDVLWNKEYFEILCGVSLETISHGGYSCDLSHTNAKIDFSKAFWPMENKSDNFYYYIPVKKINFSHMDLSESHLDKIPSAVVLTNFSYSKGRNSFLEGTKKFEYCDFQGFDFSNQEISLSDFQKNFFQCNFVDTKAKISYREDQDGLKCGEWLGKEIKKGSFTGCYINNVLIRNDKQQREVRDEYLKKYQLYEDQLYSDIFHAIDEVVDKTSMDVENFKENETSTIQKKLGVCPEEGSSGN